MIIEVPRLVDAVLTAVLPPRCLACDAPLEARRHVGLCDVCLHHNEENAGQRCTRCDAPGARVSRCASCAARAPAFTAVVAPYLYGGVIADLIAKAKFSRHEDAALALGRLLAANVRAQEALAGASAIVPVPLGWRRRFSRGFNQSAIIARVLGREHHLPVCHALVRTRATRPQSELSARARRANVAGAFAFRARIMGRCVLVDDVVTSGETVRAAATALQAAGAEEVVVLAVARAGD